MSKTDQGTTKLYIGPAGWSYKDWVGPVYPVGKRIDQLVMIARYFNCIELNSSFYRVPGERLVQSWVRRLSNAPDFTFTVKVWQRFTHERKGNSDDAKLFIHSFDLLHERGQVGAFLLQFPWSFRNDTDTRQLLQRLASWFYGYPTAVELRHGSWNTSEALRFLSESGLAFCNIDQPVIGNSIPPTAHVTDERLGYIRLHGRNRRNWFRENAGRDERYDYLYNDRELEEWRKRASHLMNRVHNLFVITNNHFRGQALANAFQLRFLFEERKPLIPHTLTSAFPALQDIVAPAATQGDFLDIT